MATKLSMIVEITSLTPRVTLRMPGIAAHIAPTITAIARTNGMWSTLGRLTSAPKYAANSAASRYWPSAPMLNRPILKPIATATPAT